MGAQVTVRCCDTLLAPTRTQNRPNEPWDNLALNGQVLSLLPSGALQIESSEETDQGKYECVATNNAGVRYSSPANLYVRGRERRHATVRGRDPPRPVPSPLGLTASGLPRPSPDPSRKAPPWFVAGPQRAWRPLSGPCL
jgi:hypothetical protein